MAQPTTPHRLFGTDGIRAPFGDFPLDQATVTGLGAALANGLREAAAEPVVALGGDTRFSTPALASWLTAGLRQGGARVRYLGTVPTPAVAWATRHIGAAAGVAISASHNPWPDNGIKLIGGDGFKWPPAAEAALEERLAATRAGDTPAPAELAVEPSLVEAYAAALAATLGSDRPLAGLRLAVDAANGAAATLAEPLFTSLGAAVTLLSAAPDGRNINRDCGSTQPRALQRAVVAQGCDLGVAFDGDADRALLVDETGALRDGDALLYLWARDLRRAGRLDPPRIVATSMSNLGLERALGALGIAVERCDVGDREVVDTMRRLGLILGGEQSGHIVHLGLSTTGDGLLTALQVAAIVAAGGVPLSTVLDGFHRFPQVLKNLRVAAKPPLDGLPTVRDAVRRATRELGDEGRLVLRYSGTEPLARVMIEGPDQATIERLADEVLAAIAGAVGEAS